MCLDCQSIAQTVQVLLVLSLSGRELVFTCVLQSDRRGCVCVCGGASLGVDCSTSGSFPAQLILLHSHPSLKHELFAVHTHTH